MSGVSNNAKQLMITAEDGALVLYTRVWAVHQLLQLHQQRFLFPQSRSVAMVMEALVILVLCKPDKSLLITAVVARNAVRVVQCPFLWDSEFWLALTDLSVLVSLTQFPTLPLHHAAPWVRRQLAVCYGAAAFFKLNTSFLDYRTSCAPIFALSLLGSAPMNQPLLVKLLARVAPICVVVVEALISGLLWSHQNHRFGEWLALVFHLMIAVTPSPNGVPTFSCVAASRLVLIIGNDGGRSAFHALERLRKYQCGFVFFTVVTAVAIVPRTSGVEPAVAFFLILAAFSGLVICTCNNGDSQTIADPISNRSRLTGHLLVTLAAIYAFVPPILGLQEIGSNTMFANMRLHGGSNHLLGVPTGLLQSLWFNDNPSKPETWLEDWFGGGVVRIEYTNSDYLNRLYPGEITSLLDPQLRSQLEKVGHVARQFNPKARRVLGTNIRMGMPFWSDDEGTVFVKYTVPGLEFRRLLADARKYAMQNRQTFDLHYTRLNGASGDENWRKRSAGYTVQLLSDDGEDGMKCTFRNEANSSSTWEKCQQSELAHQRPPPAWALKFMLFYPYAILPDSGIVGQLSPDELLCNY